MKRGTTSALILVFGLTVVLAAGLFAQVKKDTKSGLDRIEGRITDVGKDMTLTVSQSGTTKATWKISYTDKTAITMRNAPGKTGDLKEGKRIIALGKFDNNVLAASRIDIRADQ